MDVWAFGAVLLFVGSLYTGIAAWFPVLAPLRPALASSLAGAVLLLVDRLNRRSPLTIDGARGTALGVLAAWALASMSWSIYPSASKETAQELWKLFAVHLLLVNVVSTPARLRAVAAVAVLGAMVPAWGTISNWLSGLELVDGFRARWRGVYADPNHMAMDLLTVVPPAVYFITRSRSLLLKILSGISLGLTVTAIVLSHSRGGAVGLGVALAAWAMFSPQKTRGLLAGAAVALAVALFAPKSFWDRTETIAAFEEDVSAQGRLNAWKVAERINLDRPLLGVGAGTFRFAWPIYAPIEARGRAYVAHNVFLDLLGELGFPGFFAFLCFCGAALAGAFRAGSTEGFDMAALSRAYLAAGAGYLTCDLSSGYLLSSHFFLVMGMAAAADRMASAPGAVSSAAQEREIHVSSA